MKKIYGVPFNRIKKYEAVMAGMLMSVIAFGSAFIGL